MASSEYDWQAEKDDDDIVDMMVMELLSSSDEEEDEDAGPPRSRKKNKDRDFPLAYANVIRDYFSGPDSIYDEKDFERRFRVPRVIFNCIWEKLQGEYPFVGPVKDALGKPGIFPLVRLVACFRHIAYGDGYDREDEYCRMSEDSVRVSAKAFCRLVKKHFPEYLNRSPSEAEKQAITERNSRRGFPGHLASWDCKHFAWHKCPMWLHGQHKGHAEGVTLILEAIADYNCYLMYANFGDPGSLNDINVLDKSSIVGSMIDGSFNTTIEPYEINGRQRDWLYFLADGIYPDWSVFVKTYADPVDARTRCFSKHQEGARKDVERAFGILVQKFQILQRPLRMWNKADAVELLHCCVILHNMVVAHYGDDYLNQPDAKAYAEATEQDDRSWPLFGRVEVSADTIKGDGAEVFALRVSCFTGNMMSRVQHHELKEDLTEHIYTLFGEN